MITLTRRRARALRGVLRRHTLGLPCRGPVPPLVLRADGSQLRAHYRYGGLAVEHAGDGGGPTPGLVTLPLDALADVEGRDDSAVTVRALAPGRAAVCWTDRGIPRTREYEVAPVDSLDPFPEPPVDWSDAPPSLLDALADAAATATRDSTRYALDAIEIKLAGGGHEITATDGHQLLIYPGFRLPWDDTVLIPASPVFAAPALPRDLPLAVGRSVTHVAFRAGPWTLLLAPVIGRRFPDVTRILPDPTVVTSRLRLDPLDAAFLLPALDRLPGADAAYAPATLDLNGRVAVRASGSGQGPPTELILARSAYDGPPVRLNTDRAFLARAVRLGFRQVEIVDADSLVACRDRGRVFAWQPLSKDSAIAPTGDVTRIESTAVPPPTDRAVSHLKETIAVREPTDQAKAVSPHDGANFSAAPGDTVAGLAGLIAEAEALHADLATSRTRAARLVAALRRHRKRERLLTTTLASLRELKLSDVAG